MRIDELLEVAIGLILIWLALALGCMGIQEWLAGVFKFRARDLEKAIRGMLEEPAQSGSALERFIAWIKRLFRRPAGTQASSLVDQLYAHPLVKALGKAGGTPSYIPDRTFALALFDVVMTAGTDGSTIKKALEALQKKESELPQLAEQAAKDAVADLIALAGQAATDEAKLAELKKRLHTFTASYPQLKPVVDALLQASLDKGTQETLKNIAGGAARLAASNPKMAQAIGGLVTAVGDFAHESEKKLAAARTNVETWFNDTMDRLTGWYKRRAQVIGIVIGIVMAVVLNVDSVLAAAMLWREPVLRQALVAKAEEFEWPEEIEASAPAEAVKQFGKRFEGLQIPIGWKQIALKELQAEKRTCTLNPTANTTQYVWGIRTEKQCLVPADAPKDKSPNQWIGGKIAGWAISGVAASLGAPFWFDVLKKLVNVRVTGKNPAEEKKKEQSS